MTMTAHDAVLIDFARAGSPNAYAQLVARHQQAVRDFLRRFCGDWMEADDLAQETFVAAWTQLDRFAGASSLRSWLCGIAYRKALTARRARARAMARDRAYADAQGDAPTPNRDDRLDLAAAMARLPSAERAAVALCLAAGFSHAEAAESLGLPLGTVKSHVQSGKAKLLEALSDEKP